MNTQSPTTTLPTTPTAHSFLNPLNPLNPSPSTNPKILPPASRLLLPPKPYLPQPPSQQPPPPLLPHPLSTTHTIIPTQAPPPHPPPHRTQSKTASTPRRRSEAIYTLSTSTLFVSTRLDMQMLTKPDIHEMIWTKVVHITAPASPGRTEGGGYTSDMYGL